MIVLCHPSQWRIVKVYGDIERCYRTLDITEVRLSSGAQMMGTG